MDQIAHINIIAKLDLSRGERTGIPEVVFAEGKTPDDLVDILRSLAQKKGYGMASRILPCHLDAISNTVFDPYAVKIYDRARIVVVHAHDRSSICNSGPIGILSAGTSDIMVAEEARVTAMEMGCEVIYAYDVGVAGLHRLYTPLQDMINKQVSAIIVVAGMDGVLPVLVKSLVNVPVIGVPTSIGYGYGGKGEAALMNMLQSCSPGLVVVNIDNGFNAGVTATLIARQGKRDKEFEAAACNLNNYDLA